MCSSLVIKTTHYFINECSSVSVLFVNDSKAFDTVCHIDLLNVLSMHHMCALVRTLLITMYM